MTETRSKSRSSNHLRVMFEPGDEINTIWDQIIFWMLAGMILVLPMCLGVPPDYAWAETIFMIGAATMGIAYALKLITHRDQHMHWSWTYIPIAIFLLLCAVQMVRLPAGIVNILSPATLKLRADLMHDIPGSAERLRSLPLTFYLENSIRQIRLLFSVVVVFVVTLNSFRRLDQIRQLVLVIACVGGFIALIALLQDITHTDKILWMDKPSDDPFYLAHAGPFRNHSHFSQYMNLCLGAALAIALVNYKQTVRGAYSAMKDRLAAIEYQLLFGAMAVILMCALAIVLSTSRSGMAALAGSGVLALLMIAYKQRLGAARAIAGIVALLVLGTALVVAIPSVRFSFSQLSRRTYSVAEREQIWTALPAQWKQYPVVGTGLGAFEVVFPLFDISRRERMAAYAENEYAQLMTETGALGLAMALVFIGILTWSYFKVVRKGSSDAAAIAIGLGYGVLAVLIQSAFDFGQHLMANAMLMAVTCALLLNLRQVHRRAAEAQEEPRRGSVLLRAVAALVIVAIFACSIVGGVRTSIAQSSWKKAVEVEDRLRLLHWQADKSIFAQALNAASRAVKFSPHNVEYRHWLNVYRWYAGAMDLPHEKNGTVSNGPQLEKFVASLVADLNDARWLCPTYAPNYSQIGWYESFQLERDSGGDYIRTAYRLSPNNPSIVMRAGEQEAFDGHNDRSAELLNRSMSLDPYLIPGVMDFYLYEMKRPDLALAAARGKINAMQTLEDRLANSKMAPEVLATVRKELRQSYLEEAAKPKPDPWLVSLAADAEHRAGNDQHAIELYREALALNYGAVNWRLELARLLFQAGDRDGAKREAQICLRLQPHMAEAENLIAELSQDHPHPVE